MNNKSNQPETNAISVYGQEGLDDFPVLKAFQQYIDAEQNKARKRMIMLCIFFAFLMTVVVTVFLFMLRDVNTKNQTLNDKLLEYVMKNNDRQPVVVQPPAAPTGGSDIALKAMTETLAAIQKQMSEQQAKMAESQAKMAEQQLKAAQAASAAAAQAQEQIRAVALSQAARTSEGPSKEQREIQRQIDEDTAKLVKARALLKAEREKINAEKEKLRKEEVERQRRRLYPEYYEKLDSAKAAEKTTEKKSAAAPSTPQKHPAPINYFDAYDEPPPATKQPAQPAPQPKPQAKKTPKAQPRPQPKIQPQQAPKSDHYTVPVEVGGTDGDWLIPTDENSSVAK